MNKLKNETTNLNELNLATELKNLAKNYDEYKNDATFVSELHDLINKHADHSSLIYYVLHR
ncbi:hypothetical protein D1B17_04010 [Companilactobacillus zhachilii]|uniref:Uncharacterized protein n=1 Tax=Companilactobacillus zhachilii TaxID=2304606 RepID=A0A386PTZ3_9LACO|nr:hypothetical protein [Companilactobacillus zhachilii]AYE37840.1 hypothetical protein D1B17_04010 [Companilactobacillus zhachilii]